ncbi:MAG: sugar kinase [Fimbriiglobus sp.]|nr:sugar kinase [Fimbriiglobus sp.]
MIVCFGEAMVRLAPPHFARIEQCRGFDVEVGGAELNTAAGLVRLGREATWVSALPDTSLGRLVANRVREAGVGTDHLAFTTDGRCGLYFLEFGASPRASSILYDRKQSSISQVKPGSSSFWHGKKWGTFNWGEIFDGATWFHVTGITAAVIEDRDVLSEALSAARGAQVPVSVDLNYRSKLWSPDEAGRVMAGVVRGAELLIAGEADAENLFGVKGENFAEVAKQLADRFGVKHVAGTKRSTPLVWRNNFGAVGYANGELHETPTYEVEIVDRLGAGDAMASGIIHGLLDGDFLKGLQYGAAMGAIKHTIPGDLPWIDKAEVEATMTGQGLRIKR